MVLSGTPASREIDRLLDEIESLLRTCDKKKKNDELVIEMLEQVTEKLNECKAAIRAHERELRMENTPSTDLQEWKSARVQRLKSLYMVKKNKDNEMKAKMSLFGDSATAANESDRHELVGGEGGSSSSNAHAETSSQELMEQGRSMMQDDRRALERSKRLIEETKMVGAATAEALHAQTKQMERIINDLDEIKFTLKTAGNLVRDLTKSLATDKCIMTFMMLVVIAAVVLIGMKIAGFDINGSGSGAGAAAGFFFAAPDEANATATPPAAAAPAAG